MTLFQFSFNFKHARLAAHHNIITNSQLRNEAEEKSKDQTNSNIMVRQKRKSLHIDNDGVDDSIAAAAAELSSLMMETTEFPGYPCQKQQVGPFRRSRRVS